MIQDNAKQPFPSTADPPPAGAGVVACGVVPVDHPLPASKRQDQCTDEAAGQFAEATDRAAGLGGPAWGIQLDRLPRPVRFVMVGATGMGVDLLAFSLLLGIAPLGAARALAIWCAMSWNFLWNRKFTFSGARSRPALVQYVLFCLSCLLGALVNWSVSVGLCTWLDFFQDWSLLAALIGVVCGTAFNYLLSARVVFR